jgi:membrane protease YdiL (CAAX protease family)
MEGKMTFDVRTLLTARPRLAFLALSFILAWSIWIPAGLWAPKLFLPAVLLGAWTPTFAAVLLTAVSEGGAGVRRYLSGLLKWCVGLQWWLVALFSIAAISYAAVGIYVLTGGAVPPLNLPKGVSHSAWPLVAAIAFVINIFAGGPLAEDVGWRGYFLPKLRETMPAFDASLLVGVVWVIWHAPMFLFPQGGQVVGFMPFPAFALMTIAWSVFMAWVYVNTQSILMAVLFHAAINTTLGTFGVLGRGALGQSTETLAPVYLNIAVSWAAVLLILVMFGRDLTRRPRAAVGGRSGVAPALG